jgi:hypothetical protein
VYPQYTRGRLLDDGKNQAFVQPFSQLIGASPMIRIRLGDLLRSNYSRFALARLFGAADGVIKLGDSGTPIKFEGGAEKLAIIQRALSAAASSPNASYRFTMNFPGANHFTSDKDMTPSPPGVGGGNTPDQASVFNVDNSDLQYIHLEVKSVNKNTGIAQVIPTVMTSDELQQTFSLSSSDATKLNKSLKAKYQITKDIKRLVVGGKAGYAVPWLQLKPTPITLKKVFNAEFNTDIQDIDKLSEFLDPEKNALVKSFKSVAGKGLAGVIETMNFDWYDKTTWDDRLGHKAPKMCKVTISYSPIHDISPGLDSNGYNRAPIYPVGGAMGHGNDDSKSGK